MAVRGVNIALDDPGASSAGSGDCAFARDIRNATMAASAKDTIRTRIMVFLTGPRVTNVHVDRLVPLATAAESETRDPRPPPRRRDLKRPGRRAEGGGLRQDLFREGLDRAELARVIKRLQPDDVLVVTRLDRLARSTRDLLNILKAVRQAGAGSERRCAASGSGDHANYLHISAARRSSGWRCRRGRRPHVRGGSGNPVSAASGDPGLTRRDTMEGADMTISRQARAAAIATNILTARADARAADLAPIIAELRAAGVTSLRDIAAEMNRRGIPTASGRGEWQADTVRQLLARLPALRAWQERPICRPRLRQPPGRSVRRAQSRGRPTSLPPSKPYRRAALHRCGPSQQN